MLNEVLTISAIAGGPNGDGLQFAEVPPLVADRGHIFDVWWDACCFRPLVTIEDDLEAHFLHHLTTSSPQGVDA